MDRWIDTWKMNRKVDGCDDSGLKGAGLQTSDITCRCPQLLVATLA